VENIASAPGRLRQVDIAKGAACFLMILSHLLGGKLLPASTFAAPLFFAFSGMNAILFLEKSGKSRCFDLFHLVFPVLLFFGGVTQIMIVHRGPLRLAPEFLQFIALEVLLLFGLGKLFKNPRRCGWLFPLPFLVQQLLPWSFLRSFQGTPMAFLFGNGFALFPWLGFVLFGVFILDLGKRSFLRLQAALLGALVLSLAVLKIPLRKFWMSLSYMLLGLLAIALAYTLGRILAGWRINSVFGRLAEFLALPGRNSLMFVYVHYLALRYFASANFLPAFYLMLPLETLYLFLLCVLWLKFYEKVKDEPGLFYPALAMGLLLAGVRWAGWFKPGADLLLVDMAVGILFAFFYVQLRRRAAAFCRRERPARAAA
jgi:hypothetical protein